MKFSVTIVQGTTGWEIAKRAEELGYHAAWFEDSQMVVADPIVSMAMAAAHTSRIRLGTGVLIPSNRIAPQTANSIASLNAFAPGRLSLAIGTGFSGRRAMGLGPVKMKDIQSYIEVIEALLKSETVEWEFEGKRRKIRFVNADKNVTNLTDPIDIYLGAQGPKMRRLAASLKANWMSLYSSPDAAAAEYKDMQQARIEAGTPPEASKSTIVISGCPLDEGEPADSPRAMRQAGPMAAIWIHNLIEMEEHGTLGTESGIDPQILDRYRRLYQTYEPADARYLTLHRGHGLFVREAEADLITADWIRKTTLTGSVSELREHIRELKNIGYDEVSFILNTLHPPDMDMLERWLHVMEGV
jgi:5,10-methylenetetrahydromethanopterin reductase